MFIVFSIVAIVAVILVAWMIFDMEKTNRKNKVLVSECNMILDRNVEKIKEMKEMVREINVLRKLLVKDCEYLEKREGGEDDGN